MRPISVVSLILVAGLSACATGGPTDMGEPDPVYLALGDSVAFGFNPLVNNEVGVSGYPEALGKLLDVPVKNAACPGEASPGFIAADGADNGCRDNRKAYSLHTDPDILDKKRAVIEAALTRARARRVAP